MQCGQRLAQAFIGVSILGMPLDIIQQAVGFGGRLAGLGVLQRALENNGFLLRHGQAGHVGIGVGQQPSGLALPILAGRPLGDDALLDHDIRRRHKTLNRRPIKLMRRDQRAILALEAPRIPLHLGGESLGRSGIAVEQKTHVRAVFGGGAGEEGRQTLQSTPHVTGPKRRFRPGALLKKNRIGPALPFGRAPHR